jgi:hypothetical protein
MNSDDSRQDFWDPDIEQFVNDASGFFGCPIEDTEDRDCQICQRTFQEKNPEKLDEIGKLYRFSGETPDCLDCEHYDKVFRTRREWEMMEEVKEQLHSGGLLEEIEEIAKDLSEGFSHTWRFLILSRVFQFCDETLRALGIKGIVQRQAITLLVLADCPQKTIGKIVKLDQKTISNYERRYKAERLALAAIVRAPAFRQRIGKLALLDIWGEALEMSKMKTRREMLKYLRERHAELLR